MSRTPALLLAAALTALLLAGCGSDAGLRDSADCDGVLNSTETTVDDAFDEDGDGYFDASNEQCQETYDADQLDCNDIDPEINPGMVEATCNELDDDCEPTTLDDPDDDLDGATPCDGDCDDSQPLVGPEQTEELCDGLDNDCDEATSDGEDADGDGYTECEDCHDDEPEANPAAVEEECNGLDDDCNEVTPDGDDFDTDGFIHCFDCDDEDPLRYPGAPEICEDGIDQDCDTLDADCPPPTWDGLWDTSPAIAYNCASNSVVIDFASVSIVDSDPNISFTFIGGTQPGTVSGTLGIGDTFSATYSIPGLCTEDYGFSGSFTGPNDFSATLTATFSDASGTGLLCGDCVNQSWNITGTR